MGDFNDHPQSEPILAMKSWIDSAFGDSDPEFTTWKFREKEGTVKRTIDYVFKKGNLHTTDVLQLPKAEDCDSHMANPCANHPSDHYAQGYVLSF